ncbi:hypothetical protein [Haloferula sargassicola]|uniref:Uncharacterized protein n=1 Tax=Haloferula sargassicola TaxID=490096 RepID=A0ABP9UPQ7_9BACT
MTEKAQAILEQAEKLDDAEMEYLAWRLKQRLDEEYQKEGIRIAGERLAQVERGEVEMIPWDEAMKKWRKLAE